MGSLQCIVTGAAGFIGSHLVTKLLRDGFRVIGIDNFATGRSGNLTEVQNKTSFEFVEADAASPDLRSYYERSDYVFHQAAIPSVPRSFEKPSESHRANATLTLEILEMLKGSKRLRKFVYASSSSIYGDTPILPKVESMPPNPLSPYAAQKFMSERYCQIYAREFNMPTVALRYFNVFGPRQDPHSPYSAVISKFTSLIRRNETLTIFGDGNQTRDFTYVENVVHANILAAERGIPGKIYNIAGGKSISLLELIAELEKISELQAKRDHRESRKGDIRDSLADLTMAKKDLGYEAKIDFYEGLKRTWAYESTH